MLILFCLNTINMSFMYYNCNTYCRYQIDKPLIMFVQNWMWSTVSKIFHHLSDQTVSTITHLGLNINKNTGARSTQVVVHTVSFCTSLCVCWNKISENFMQHYFLLLYSFSSTEISALVTYWIYFSYNIFR